MDLRSLLSCFSVAMLGVAICAYLPDWVVTHGRVRSVALGLLMGGSACASMMVPMQIEPGLIIDLRMPLLATAGLIGGPIAGAVGALLALACRTQINGVGMWAGLFAIGLAAAIGAGASVLAGQRKLGARDLGLAAAAVAAGGILTVFLLPPSKWQAILSVAGYSAALTFGCTWLFALSLMRDEQFRALVHRNAIYRTIIDTLPDSLNAKDAQGRFIAANPATLRLMGAASAADLLGRSDADFYPADVAEGFRTEEREVLDGNTVGPLDQEVRFPNGSSRWLTSLKTPLRDARGKVAGIVTHNRDVTEERRLAAELLRTQGFLREAMAHMADGLVLFDEHGVIRFCNEQYRALFPLTRDLRAAGGQLPAILREALRRGEHPPKPNAALWIGEQVRELGKERDFLLELADERVIEVRSRPVGDGDTLVVYTDVTARRRVERDLLRRATHDPLTGLANRAEFEFQLRAAQERALTADAPFAVLMMDLDRFKAVNDTFGHVAGDQLLTEVAARLRGSVRGGDLVARLGGDEFAFLIFGQDAALGAQCLAERALRALREPFAVEGTTLIPTGSFGIATFAPVADPMKLLVLADEALYAAKRSGGSRYRFAGPQGTSSDDRPALVA